MWAVLLLLVDAAANAINFGPSTQFNSVSIGRHSLQRNSSCAKCVTSEFNESCVGNDPVRYTNPQVDDMYLPTNQITIEAWVKLPANPNSSMNFLSFYSGMSERIHEPQTGFRLGFHENFPVFGVALATDTSGTTLFWTQETTAVSGPPLS